MKNILIIHGPNLNMLGRREPGIYGNCTLEDINRGLEDLARGLGVAASFFQSNHEGEIVTRIQQAEGRIAGLIINPAAYTHTSVAIRDALLVLDVPVIEVHISNIHKREAFRRHSYVSDVAAASLCGFGPQGYEMALRGLVNMI